MICTNPDCDRNKLVDPPLPCRCVQAVPMQDRNDLVGAICIAEFEFATHQTPKQIGALLDAKIDNLRMSMIYELIARKKINGYAENVTEPQ